MTHLLPLQEGTFVMPLKPLSWSFSGWKSVLSLESPVSLREEQTQMRAHALIWTSDSSLKANIMGEWS